jgi:hypothetical protein
MIEKIINWFKKLFKIGIIKSIPYVVPTKERIKNMGFWVYFCPCHIHPTITVGISTISSYEMFINYSAFGDPIKNPTGINNGDILNMVYLALEKNSELTKELCEKGNFIIEIQFTDDIIINIRKVEKEFLGISNTFSESIINAVPYFLQVYMKGDSHVLEDLYYSNMAGTC